MQEPATIDSDPISEREGLVMGKSFAYAGPTGNITVVTPESGGVEAGFEVSRFRSFKTGRNVETSKL